MKLKVSAAGFSLGVMGVIYMLVVNYYPELSQAVLGMTKGESLRAFMEDIYPYYDHATWYAPLLGSAYGFLDAFFFGVIASFLYNSCLCSCGECCMPEKKMTVSPAPVAKAQVEKTPVKKVAAKKDTAKKASATKKTAPKRKPVAKKATARKKK